MDIFILRPPTSRKGATIFVSHSPLARNPLSKLILIIVLLLPLLSGRQEQDQINTNFHKAPSSAPKPLNQQLIFPELPPTRQTLSHVSVLEAEKKGKPLVGQGTIQEKMNEDQQMKKRPSNDSKDRDDEQEINKEHIFGRELLERKEEKDKNESESESEEGRTVKSHRIEKKVIYRPRSPDFIEVPRIIPKKAKVPKEEPEASRACLAVKL